MVLSGTPASKVGASAGFTKAAVTGWVKTVDEQGFEALMPKRKSGRPPKLTAAQKEKIDEILQTDPEVSGFKVWDGPTLSTYIKESFGIELGVRQCQRLFKELGYSQIRPQTFPSKDQDDSQAREEFKKTRRDSCQWKLDTCLSGRSSLPDTDYYYVWMVQERESAAGEIFSWTYESLLQRLC